VATLQKNRNVRKILLLNLSRIFDSPFWQGALSIMTGWVLSFLAPLWPFLVLMFALVLADLYSGVKAARRRKEIITSKGFRRTVEKITMYTLAIMLAHGMSVVFLPSFDLAWLPAFAICVAEIKSNFENIYSITGVDVGEEVMELLKKKIRK
jgi:phage-related holin